MQHMSMSHEDYLEALVMLGATDTQAVRSVEVAEMLEVSKASVNKAVAALKDAGYVDQVFYGGITLTSEGLAYGKDVLKRHEMLILFLTKALGIPEERAAVEACQMEHAISDESFKHWFDFIEKLKLS